MTREPCQTEAQIRGLVGFHCTDQAAFDEMVAWLDRTVGRLEHLEDENAKLKARADRAWEDVLWERKQHANRLAAAKAAAQIDRERCAATHHRALHTVGELQALARRGAKTVRLATILDLDEGDDS